MYVTIAKKSKIDLIQSFFCAFLGPFNWKGLKKGTSGITIMVNGSDTGSTKIHANFYVKKQAKPDRKYF